MRICDVLTEFLLDGKAGGFSAKTLDVYAYNLQALLAHLEQQGVQSLEELLPHHLRGFLAGLQDRDLSPWTVDQFYRSTKTFLRWAIRQGYATTNPLEQVRRPRLPRHLVPRLSLEQVQDLLQVVANHPLFLERNLAIVLLLVDSGLRAGEVVHLNVTDVQGALLRVVGKGNKERWVPLGETSRNAIAAYLRVRDDGDCPALFLSRKGCRFTLSGVHQLLWKLRHELGVDRLYPHLLRHTFANLYLRSDGDLRSLQLILGHADVQTTAMIYTDPDIRDLQTKHQRHSPLSQIA